MRRGMVVGAAVGSAAWAGRRAERALLARWDDGRAGAETAGVLHEGRRRSVRTDDGAELAVTEWGDGPPVVLVHGITASTPDWEPVLPALLGAGRRVIALDQRGHGASTLGAAPCDTRRLAADLALVLEALDVSAAVVAGHSLGGYVGLALAAHHPDVVRDRVTALVVLGGTHTGRGVRELTTLANVAAPWTAPLQRSDVHGAVVTGLAVFGSSPELTAIDDVRLRWAACDARTRRCFARHLAGEHVTPHLAAIDLPVVVARGSRDHIITARRARAMARRLRTARLEVVEGAGHALLPERPEVVAALILGAAPAP